MKNAAIRFAVLSGVILAVAMSAMGIRGYQMDENIIYITAYIVLPRLALLYIASFVPRFRVSKCLSYGGHIPANAAYHPYCGKKIQQEVKSEHRIFSVMIRLGKRTLSFPHKTERL